MFTHDSSGNVVDASNVEYAVRELREAGLAHRPYRDLADVLTSPVSYRPLANIDCVHLFLRIGLSRAGMRAYPMRSSSAKATNSMERLTPSLPRDCRHSTEPWT